MKWNATLKISAVIVFALAAALAGRIHADCGSSQRTSYKNASCLDADHEDGYNFPSFYGNAEATNECAKYGGVVVAKVDRMGCTDWTWHLTTGATRHGSGNCKIRGVYCCEDLSDFCDKPELSDSTCADQFSRSSASATCDEEAITFENSGYGDNEDPGDCKVVATCPTTPPTKPESVQNTIFATFKGTAELLNCNGVMRVGSCWYGY